MTRPLQQEPRYRAVSDKKAGGATYTPARLADFVADKMLKLADLSGPCEPLEVLDPAVGDGALLFSLLARLQGLFHGPIRVIGFETDTLALAAARRRLARAFPAVTLELRTQSFLDWVLANTEPRFHLVIANPPYVRTQILGASQARGIAGAFALKGRIDLSHAFLIGITRFLHPRGVAGIIVSNRFMTTRAGAPIREILRRHLLLRHVWDLGDTKLFEAAVLPAVLLAQGLAERQTAGSSASAFTSIYETAVSADRTAAEPLAALASSGVVAVADGRRFVVQQGVLDKSGRADAVWRMANAGLDAFRAAILLRRWGCFRNIGRVRVGVKTCADKVFIRHDWNDLPAELRPELLRPLTTHHVARRFRATTLQKPRAILYPHGGVQGKRSVVDLADHPRSRAYLELHRDLLCRRSYVLAAGRRWYELWVPQDPEAWSAAKLVFRDIAEEPTFWMDLEGTIVNGDCYFITADQKEKEDLLWLAAGVANSALIQTYYDLQFNNRLYSGRRRFISQYVEEFPLPDPSLPSSQELMALSRELYQKVDSAEAPALEARLNHLVSQAFSPPSG